MAESSKVENGNYFESADEWREAKGSTFRPSSAGSADDFQDSRMLRKELEFLIARKGADRTKHLQAICDTIPSLDDLGPGPAPDPTRDQTRGPETKRLKQRSDQDHLIGLAFSGGGIRSATFCLGVMQRLARNNIFRHVDYLSTVSGGGYTGTALAWWLSGKPFDENKEGDGPPKPADFDSEDYMPFGTEDPHENGVTDPAPLQHLRRNSSYLIPGSGITIMSGIAVVLRAVLLNLLVWVPIVAFAFIVLAWLERSSTFFDNHFSSVDTFGAPIGGLFLGAYYLAGIVVALFAICSAAYSLHSSINDESVADSSTYGKFGFLARLEDWIAEQKWYFSISVQTLSILLLAAIIFALSFLYLGSIFIANNKLEQVPLVGSILSRLEMPFWISTWLEANRSSLLFELALSTTLFFTVWFCFGKKYVPYSLAACGVLYFFGTLDEVGLFAVITAVFSIIAVLMGQFIANAFRRPGISISYSGRRAFEKWFGKCVMWVAALLIFASIPWFHQKIGSEGFTGIASLSAGAASGLWGFAQTQGKGGFSRWTSLILAFGSAAFIFGILLVGYAWTSSMLALTIPGPIKFNDVPTEFWAILLISVFSGLITNLNYISLGRFYRDRLMEAFMPSWGTANLETASGAGSADRFYISNLWNNEQGVPVRGPYPIVNTNVVLVNSPNQKFRKRGGDNFIITPCVCGSHATGWENTSKFEGGQITLATAMAISGAAANPNAGPGGKGPTTNRAVSVVMTLLNFRLGYWVKRPRRAARSFLKIKPNHFFPSAAYSLSNNGYKESSGYLELSDGGHFENLAMYELIRRRTRLIIVCDGGQDASASYSDFVSFLRRIDDDFDAKIDFFEHAGPEFLVTGPVDGAYPKGAEFSQRGYFLAKVDYGKRGQAWGNADQGLIIYLKTTMIKELSMTAKGYKGANPSFPDQSTGDQFFDEEQFEAYREVGYRICSEMINDLQLEDHFEESKRPALGADFMKRIEKNYLAPSTQKSRSKASRSKKHQL